MDRTAEIIAAARDLLESEGPESVTMRRIGERLGIRAPSLYKHVSGREQILAGVQAAAVRDFGVVMADAATDPGGPAAGMARAYRAWALAHPALYELMMRHPLNRDELPAGLEQEAESPVMSLAGGNRDVARAFWALAHGLVDLELAGRFPPGADIGRAWEAGISAFATTDRLR